MIYNVLTEKPSVKTPKAFLLYYYVSNNYSRGTQKRAAMIIAIRFIFFFYQVKFSGSFASLERRFLLSELILFISSSESSKAATSRFSWR